MACILYTSQYVDNELAPHSGDFEPQRGKKTIWKIAKSYEMTMKIFKKTSFIHAFNKNNAPMLIGMLLK